MLSPQGEIGLWHIRETEAFFREELQLTEAEKRYIDGVKGHRRIESLAVRYLLHLMSGRKIRGACRKDAFGKPFLEDSPFHISISHTTDWAAVIAAPVIVGIDVQRYVPKIDQLAPKFMRETEFESLQPDSRLEHLHVYWGAKEALYKAYGRRQLDFKSNILIDPFVYDPAGGTFTGQIEKDDYRQLFQLEYHLIEDGVYVFARIVFNG